MGAATKLRSAGSPRYLQSVSLCPREFPGSTAPPEALLHTEEQQLNHRELSETSCASQIGRKLKRKEIPVLLKYTRGEGRVFQVCHKRQLLGIAALIFSKLDGMGDLSQQSCFPCSYTEPGLVASILFGLTDLWAAPSLPHIHLDETFSLSQLQV